MGEERWDAFISYGHEDAEWVGALAGLDTPEIREGLRRFNQRDHPDRNTDTDTVTPGIVRQAAATTCATPQAAGSRRM